MKNWIKTMGFCVPLAGVLIFAAVVAGCDQTPGISSYRYTNIKQTGLDIVTDEDTGCQYLYYPGHAITPRFAADGQIICKAPK